MLIICILFSINSYSQIPEGALVNIYIIPFGKEPFASEDATSDYVRIHAKVKIVLSPGRLVDELYTKMESTKRQLLYTNKKCDFNRCKMVIDFVKGDDIYYSMTISYSFDFYIENNIRNREIEIYKGDLDFMCYLNKLLPYLIQTDESIICR